MSIQVASSSSLSLTSETKYRYDVFLSFRGEDTRHSFTIILYDALRRKGINTFIDDKKLGKGKRISPALLKAIEKSRIAIIVFSRNYATSTWCLEELAHIIRCTKENNQQVMPIFYKVDPMDVQYQRNNFGEAMAALEDRFRDDLEKVRKWRSALSEAASLSSAWLFKDGYEPGFIERIVADAYTKLPPKRLHSTDHMVGLDFRIKEVMSILDQSDSGVCMLGIHGTGGIGKTTLAKALFNSIFYHFEGVCFLFDVKEASKKYQGMVRLQQKLLSEILEEKSKIFGSVDEGISRIKHRLSRKRVLLVLDDVDKLDQLEQLAGGCDWFGSGSKVIITTRNKQLLIARNVENIYEMKKLNDYDSLELFCWYAFHMSRPPNGYKDMSHHVISYVQGLPLALRVIGSNLSDKRLEEWRPILEQYERIPEQGIHEILKISYDNLQHNAKSLFLDIACFFKNELSAINEILEASDFGARFYFEVLVDKSLIYVDEYGGLEMHDLIEEMGREIVRLEAPFNLGKRSRLWNYADVLRVLHKNLGSRNIQGIMLDPPQLEEVEWSGIAFEKMNNLIILIVRNAQFSTGPKYFPNSLRLLNWEGYPSMTLPPYFYPEKLVILKLCGSHIRLGESFKTFEQVTRMDFSHCKFITEVPDMSRVPNLRELRFLECQNLIKVHDSVGSLSKLVLLMFSGCTKLRSFPHEINMPSLESLFLSNCQNLDFFPNIVGKMDALTDVSAKDTAIKELPPSIGNLRGLEYLDISSCKNLRDLPSCLFTLKNLNWLEIRDPQPHSGKSLMKLMQESQSVLSCSDIEFLNLKNCRLVDEDLHLILNGFRKLQQLTLSENDFVSLPECIKECTNLFQLEMNNCKSLRDIPELPSKLENLRPENCTSLTTESLSRLWSQARKLIHGMRISISASKFPDWFDNCCEGGTLSFRVRDNFPLMALAVEFGKANANVRSKHFYVCLSIKGCETERKILGDMPYPCREGHVYLLHLRRAIDREDWRMLNRFLGEDWNDVEIGFKCDPPGLSVVNCGVYVFKQQTNMENVQFKCSQLSMNDPTTSLKRRAITYPLNDQTKKLNQEVHEEDQELNEENKDCASNG